MTLIEKNNVMTLSHQEIEQDHAIFITLVNQLDQASDSEFAALFEQLMAHTSQHFERENHLMQEYAFPAVDEHRNEHHRVLAEFKQFKTRIDKGLIGFGRAYIRERLPEWFSLHTATMDSALVAHINSNHQRL